MRFLWTLSYPLRQCLGVGAHGDACLTWEGAAIPLAALLLCILNSTEWWHVPHLQHNGSWAEGLRV